MPNFIRRWRILRTYRELCAAFAYSAAVRQRMAWWRKRYEEHH